MKISKKIILFFLFATFIVTGCSNNTKNSASSTSALSFEDRVESTANAKETFEDYKPKAVRDIHLPTGFERTLAAKNSFEEFLQNFPIKQGDNKVHLYDGSLKYNQKAQFAILNIDVGNRDLQQCADAVMRLRAEYLFQQKKYDQIHFNFTNGTKADYSKYAQGYRPQIKGNSVSWGKTTSPNTSYQTFRKYMDIVFSYAGSSSLSKELKTVDNIANIQIGDVFIRGGFPGHAIIVMDTAKNNQTGETLFLVAQSYMPAQEMHVLNNPNDPNLSPWYSTNFENDLVTPEWIFKKTELKRF